jgi:hypothetical protein
MSYPPKYQQLNTAQVKQLNVVLEIEGLPFYISLLPAYKKIRYGDPISYGDPGLVYGSLVKRDDVYPYLSVNSSLSISQKVEPEQGRGSASVMSFEFIDYQGFMTKVVSSGQYLDEFLGGKMIKVWVGYQNSSFKEDYFVVFRGYATGVSSTPTKIMVQCTDAFYKLKQQDFLLPKTLVRAHSENFTQSNVDVLSYINPPGGNLLQNDMVVNFYNPLGLPSGLTSADFYVVQADSTKFRVSTTQGGLYVTISSSWAGTTACTMKNTGPTSTYIPVIKTDGLTNKVLGPDGTIDSSLKTYVRIDDEFMEYQKDAFGADFITVSRGAQGTIPVGHDVGVDTLNQVILEDNILLLSLRMMLSGWNGPWINNIQLYAINDTGDPITGIEANVFVLPDGLDAVESYGLAVGDYLYLTGSLAGNDGTYTVRNIGNARGYPNNLIFVSKVGGGNTNLENPFPGTMAIRSQYDTWPTNCGMQLRTTDVDVTDYQYNYDVFASQVDNTFRLLIKEPVNAKETIEKEFLLPAGAYGVTRFGRISCVFTAPPIAGDNLQILNLDTIIDPQNITITRAINNRRYWSEIQHFFDYNLLTDNALSLVARLDTDSLNRFTVSQVLPIQARGLRTDLGAQSFVNRRAQYLLNRYNNVAQEIKIKTNWKTASLLQAGDSIGLYDKGTLHLSNFNTGQRDLGFQLYEIIDWALDIKTGTATLTLLSTANYQVSDRFATIAPSSLVDAGSTPTQIRIKDSFGAKYPDNESQKWVQIVGDLISVHSEDYTTYEEVQLLSVDPIDKFVLNVAGLSFTPSAGMIVDCASYPTTTDPNDQFRTKLLYDSLSPTVAVVTGTSQTVFDVSAPDAAKFNIGLTVVVRNDNWSVASPECAVLSVVGTTVTLATPLGFIPDNTYFVDGIGFKDGLGFYRAL